MTTPRDGVAETYFSIAGALSGEASDSYTLLYSRMAEFLRPGLTDAMLVSGGPARDARAARRRGRDLPPRPARGPGLRRWPSWAAPTRCEQSGRTDAAIEVMQSLAESHGDLSEVHVALGDALRRLERFDEATAAYDRAIALFDGEDAGQWGVYFARGIANERTDRWNEAEADFRKALQLHA